MTDLSLWKLATDAGLVLALLYLCTRFIRGNRPVNTARLIGLQRGLKQVLKEAEQASQQLEVKLTDRQRELEQLLYDLQTVESRVNKAIDTAEHTRRSIMQVNAQPPVHESPQVQAAPVQPVAPSQPVQGYATSSGSFEQSVGYASQPAGNPSFAVAEPASFDVRGAASEHLRQTASTPPSDVPRNIFGEPIESAQVASPVQQPASPEQQKISNLASQIEREVAEPGTMASPAATPQASIEDVYAKAEELLKQGKSLESVSAGMSLPIDEVRMLQQIISSQKQGLSPEGIAPQTAPPVGEDDRLGVLGGSIRRTRQVL